MHPHISWACWGEIYNAQSDNDVVSGADFRLHTLKPVWLQNLIVWAIEPMPLIFWVPSAPCAINCNNMGRTIMNDTAPKIAMSIPPKGHNRKFEPPMAETENTANKASNSFSKWNVKTLVGPDIVLPIGIVVILCVLLIPLPTWLLDISLALSISFSFIILMTVIFIQSPKELSSFPTILLIATMIRLSLNVASTRLILSEGHTGTNAAGEVIQAFGGFIAGGNYVIGIILFAILVIINFIVITKGAGRIAEVAARFTLDAMPGKQMAIDADLSSGLLSEDEAKQKRKDMEGESAFFGA